jgi:predicted RND superfamily exporter protein
MTHNIEAINQWFKEVGERLVALRWGIILALIGIDVLAFVGVPKIRLDNSTESWFLEDDPMTIARNEFVETFGNDDYVGILIEADDVFAPEMLHLIRELGEELKENVPFADEVTSITDFDFTQGTDEGVEIGNIVPDEIPSDLQTIEDIRALAFSKKFLVNRLFSDDSRQAWIILRLNPFPGDWEETLDEYPQLLVGREVLKIVKQQKYARYKILPTAMPVMRYEEREFFAQEGNKLVAISVLIALPVLFIFLRTGQKVSVFP